MYAKVFRYHILERDYATWVHLSRTSNQIYAGFDGVTCQQTPTRKHGGLMHIEECVCYPSVEHCEEIERCLKDDPDACALSEAFHELICTELHIEEHHL